MKVSDIVCRQNGKSIFSITSIELSSDIKTATLVEVSPENTLQHLDYDAKPITISINELNAYYSLVK